MISAANKKILQTKVDWLNRAAGLDESNGYVLEYAYGGVALRARGGSADPVGRGHRSFREAELIIDAYLCGYRDAAIPTPKPKRATP